MFLISRISKCRLSNLDFIYTIARGHFFFVATMKLLSKLWMLQLSKERFKVKTLNFHSNRPLHLPSFYSYTFTQSVIISPHCSRLFCLPQKNYHVKCHSFYNTFRNFASIPPRNRNKDPSGSPISWLTVGLTFTFGSILILVLKNVMYKKEKEFDSELVKSYGRPELGGDFELVDQDGKLCSNRDFIGKWILIYFGFTHCPDICPEELEKMGYVVDSVNRNFGAALLHPVFISIDPERDTPDAVKKYIADFHPSMIGLTGSREQVDDASRAFRVYYSAGPKDDESDYLVDHTVIMYLIDDDGEFCQYYGQNKSAGEIASNITATVAKKIKAQSS